MSRPLIWTGYTILRVYQCDLCGAEEERVLNDSFTDKDICFTCASMGERGLFWNVTMSPEEDGDNLMDVARELGLLKEEE